MQIPRVKPTWNLNSDFYQNRRMEIFFVIKDVCFNIGLYALYINSIIAHLEGS